MVVWVPGVLLLCLFSRVGGGDRGHTPLRASHAVPETDAACRDDGDARHEHMGFLACGIVGLFLYMCVDVRERVVRSVR